MPQIGVRENETEGCVHNILVGSDYTLVGETKLTAYPRAKKDVSYFDREISSMSAILTRSGRDFAPSFFMTLCR
jgi:hypothetical protein